MNALVVLRARLNHVRVSQNKIRCRIVTPLKTCTKQILFRATKIQFQGRRAGKSQRCPNVLTRDVNVENARTINVSPDNREHPYFYLLKSASITALDEIRQLAATRLEKQNKT